MHTHFSALHALNVFLVVLLMGTIWRLSSLHLMSSRNEAFNRLGQALSFQY